MPHRPLKTENGLSRRSFARNVGAGLAGLALPHGLFASSVEPRPESRTPLGALAAKKKIGFGFALNQRLLTANADYAALVARECTIVTPENAMKWDAVHPRPDTFTFDKADDIVTFAERHAIKVRGHALCWHRATPAWVTTVVNKANAEAVLRKHITTVVGHYQGRIHSWDVVNEALQLRDGLPGGWRKSLWYEMLGPSYMDIAFDAARSSDPKAVLTYNDYGLEYANQADAEKRKAVLDMLVSLKKRGVPVQALGLQAHLRTGQELAADLPHFIQEVHDLGLQVFVTELDVDDRPLTLSGTAREMAIADTYERFLDVVLRTRRIAAVLTWGAWDLSNMAADGLPAPESLRALLFYRGGEPKLEAAAVAHAFQQCKEYEAPPPGRTSPTT